MLRIQKGKQQEMEGIILEPMVPENPLLRKEEEINCNFAYKKSWERSPLTKR